MSHLPQIQLVNPSFQPTTKWYVSLSPYVKTVNTGFVLDDVIGNRKGDTLLFDAGKFLKKLNRRNHIQASAIADFGIGVRINPKQNCPKRFGLVKTVLES